MSNRLKIKNLESSHRDLSIGICMGPIRGGGGGGRSPGGGPFFRGVFKIFPGHFYGISNISAESSA